MERLKQVRWIWVLIAWTGFLWLSRLRNVLNNDDLTSSGRAVRVGVVVIFVSLGVAGAFGVLRNVSRLVTVLLIWTAGYWLIRGIGILIDGDYSVGFKAVHTVLMAISLILVGLAARPRSAAR